MEHLRCIPRVGSKSVGVRNKTPTKQTQIYIRVVIDRNETYLSCKGIKKVKSVGAEVVVFVLHLTDVLQPLDKKKAVSGALKTAFRKYEPKWRKQKKHCEPSFVNFVKFWTTAYINYLTPVNILACFRACWMAPFDVERFLCHRSGERIENELEQPPPMLAPTASPLGGSNVSPRASKHNASA